MKSLTKIAWVALLLIVVIIILASCSTTSKTKSYSKSSVDSSSVTRVDSNVARSSDSVTVKKNNTVTTVEKQDDYTKETVIEFDTSRLNNWGPGLTQALIDSDIASGKPLTTGWITAADYFPPIRKITIKETGTRKEKSVVAANTYDSSAHKASEELRLQKEKEERVKRETEVKNKQVDRTSRWGWLWFLLIPAVWLAGWWLGLWPLIPKRKKNDEYPVKKKTLTS